MRVLQVSTYYLPYISGYTVYVQRLSQALASMGHQVTVLTSQFDPALPLLEHVQGVKIIRVSVALRVSKDVIMPSFGGAARRLMREHDLVHTHLPQFDAAGLAFNAKLMGKPSLLTYHCDITLPPSLIKLAAQPAIELMNNLAAKWIDCIVMVGFVLVSFASVPSLNSTVQSIIAFALVVFVIGTATFFALALAPNRTERLAQQLIDKIVPTRFRAPLIGFVQKFVAGAQCLRSPKISSDTLCSALCWAAISCSACRTYL